MLVEIIGYIVEPPGFDLHEDGSFTIDQPERIFEPIALNPRAVSFIMPGDDEQNALVFTLDGMTIMTKNPYHFVKNKLQSDYLPIGLDQRKN